MNKQDCILNAALTLFVEQGEQATSMNWIAKKAGCGIGTMYNYFESKEDLINQLYINIRKELYNYTVNKINPKESTKKQFMDFWASAMEYAIENPIKCRYIAAFAHSPKLCKLAQNELKDLIKPVDDFYNKGKEEGIIKDLPNYQLIAFTQGAINATILEQPQTNKNAQHVLLKMIWDAVRN